VSHVLILGGGGFLGANLSRGLLQAEFKVSILEKPGADLSRLANILPQLNVFEIPLQETAQIRDIIRSAGIDTVIHLASTLLPSSLGTDFAREQQEVIAPTSLLLAELAELGVKVVFFSSGGTVYGKSLEGPFRETDPRAPINFYGLSKSLTEESIGFLHRVAGLKSLILRPSNPYGRFQSLRGSQGFISVVIGKALAGEPIEIWGDGSVVRDYLSVDDLTQAVIKLLAQDVHGITLNVGSGTGHSLVEVVAAIEDVIGRKLSVVFQPRRSVDVPVAVLDIANLRQHIPFEPINLHQGIADYYRWIKARHAN
jgi:UDP-glucose 4-epimerase